MCLFIYLPLRSAGRSLGLTPEGNRHAAEVILFPFVWDPPREVLYLYGVSSSSHTCTRAHGAGISLSKFKPAPHLLQHPVGLVEMKTTPSSCRSSYVFHPNDQLKALASSKPSPEGNGSGKT